MNELIETIFANFTVNGVRIPVAFLYYNGHDEPYITYMQQDMDGSYSGDDELQGYVDYYDFDVYSKDNYFPIIESMKEILKQNGFVWQPSRSSIDMFEADTGYYHKTLNFAILRQNGERHIVSI